MISCYENLSRLAHNIHATCIPFFSHDLVRGNYESIPGQWAHRVVCFVSEMLMYLLRVGVYVVLFLIQYYFRGIVYSSVFRVLYNISYKEFECYKIVKNIGLFYI